MKSTYAARTAALCALLVAVGWPQVARAADTSQAPASPPAQPADAWTPDDMVFVDLADQFRISPDGNFAVWVKHVADRRTDSRLGRLMISSMKNSEEIELTRGQETIEQPRWSPDGKVVAFLSNRPRPSATFNSTGDHLWLINPYGGEAWPASASNLEVKHFEWDGSDTIVFSATEDTSWYAAQAKNQEDDSIVIDDDAHAPPVRLFRLSVSTGKITRLTNDEGRIDTFDVSPDGKRAVVMRSRELSYQWDRKTAPAVSIVDLSSGREQEIFTKGNLYPRVVRWAADNSGVYAIVPYSSLFAQPSGFVRLMYFYDLATDTAEKVNLEWEKGVGFLQHFDITPDGFMVLLADGVRFKLARYTRHGSTWSHEWISGEHDKHYFDFVLGPEAHSLVFEYSTASAPPEWFRAQLDGANIHSEAVLADVVPQLRKKIAAKTEVIHWKGANDDEVDGILYYPDHYKRGQAYPLVTYTHGGPMGADLDSWSANPAYIANLLTQRGAFVLSTNYHGSANYGEKWAESICCGKYYELEIPDIQKGVDSLIAKGLVDPDRIGAFGWSNGAILSTQLTVEDPSRYKAAVVGAGDVEFVSDWANSNAGYAFDNFYFGKSLFDDPDLFIRKSPLYRMDRVHTPTLIMQGTADDTVPTEQGWLYYRALYFLHKAPVRFVLFPGEGHFPMKLSHQIRVTREELAWFDRYLFHTSDSENESLKPGSPLAGTLKNPVQRSGADYGIAFVVRSDDRSALVPETVRYHGLQVGRFEVTRAQFAAFDKDYKVLPGFENYPASGISFEQARTYCKWLTRVTGQEYRLPTQQDVVKLYGTHAAGNTMDYWAGYTVNPDDAKRLEQLMAKLPVDELLKPVGSFIGEEDEGGGLIYDLTGNVAEWVSSDGKGELYGGSADLPADPKADGRASGTSFAGFRVVREQSSAGK